MDDNTSEIAKLTERISRDPKSKLFVPLAEEYKKAGDIEMAVHVLTEGLKNNPGYITARSFLGRLLLDMGDMASARREFEEVVNAVPDNLLAQKKLGDLHALMGNRTEALNYYKAARSLNPADAEIASLISDLEAGIDVRPMLMQQETAPASRHAVPAGPDSTRQPECGDRENGTPPLEEATGGLTKELGPAMPEAAVSATSAKPPEAVSSTTTAEPPPSAVIPEEAEEVLLVEPLEEESFPAEEAGPPAGEQVLQSDESTLPFPDSDLAGEATSREEVPPDTTEPAAQWTGDTSDDFTTDTLAELYINQGFYEKAVYIYERMLADHPDSAVLKDKLEQVRSLAASSETTTEQSVRGHGGDEEAARESESVKLNGAPEFEAADTANEETALDAELIAAPEKARPDTTAARRPEDLFAEPQEYRPPEESGETAGSENFFEAVVNPPAQEFSAAGTARPAFEPSEYSPPTAELGKAGEEKGRGGQKQQRTGRQETIDRLENWLKNIKKEN